MVKLSVALVLFFFFANCGNTSDPRSDGGKCRNVKGYRVTAKLVRAAEDVIINSFFTTDEFENSKHPRMFWLVVGSPDTIWAKNRELLNAMISLSPEGVKAMAMYMMFHVPASAVTDIDSFHNHVMKTGGVQNARGDRFTMRSGNEGYEICPLTSTGDIESSDCVRITWDRNISLSDGQLVKAEGLFIPRFPSSSANIRSRRN